MTLVPVFVNVAVLLVVCACVLALCWRDLFPEAPSRSASVDPSRTLCEPSRGASAIEPTDALFDTSSAGLYRHRIPRSPREEIDFWAYHATVGMTAGFPNGAYDCAREAAHFAFQLRPDLKPPIIERRFVNVVEFVPRAVQSRMVH